MLQKVFAFRSISWRYFTRCIFKMNGEVIVLLLAYERTLMPTYLHTILDVQCAVRRLAVFHKTNFIDSFIHRHLLSAAVNQSSKLNRFYEYILSSRWKNSQAKIVLLRIFLKSELSLRFEIRSNDTWSRTSFGSQGA